MLLKKLTAAVAAVLTISLVPAASEAVPPSENGINAPVVAQKLPIARTTVDVTFPAPASDVTIDNYDIWVSDDNGLTYNKKYRAYDNRSTLWFQIPVPEASLRLVKVRATSGSLLGAWSDPILVRTKGGRPMRVYIQTPDGVPVVGGSVTWAMADGSARSSKTYGLSDAGYIDFPQAPSGPVDMTIQDAELPDGVLVSGAMTAVLGFAQTVISIPRPPQALHVVQVVLPNGLPVSGAHVDVNSEDMTDMTQLQGFTFKLPNSGLLTNTLDVEPNVGSSNADTSSSDSSSGTTVINNSYTQVVNVANFDDEYWDFDTYSYWDASSTSGLLGSHSSRYGVARRAPSVITNPGPVVASGTTNTMGRFVVKGFTNNVPTATVSFDDGVIAQTQTVQLNNAVTSVELDFIPYLTATDTDFTATANNVVSVPVVLSDANTAPSLRRTGSSAPKSGVKIIIVPPKGAPTGKCKGVAATYATNAKGQATVKVCATKSGNYRLKSKTGGALSMGAVRIYVKGSAPMPPRQVQGRSLTPGALTATWKAPEYAGGAKAVSYKVTLSARGSKSLTQTTTKLTASFSSLKNATKYTVTVVAVTKSGASDRVQIQVPVV